MLLALSQACFSSVHASKRDSPSRKYMPCAGQCSPLCPAVVAACTSHERRDPHLAWRGGS